MTPPRGHRLLKKPLKSFLPLDIQQTKHIVMIIKEASTIIVKFTQPGSEALVLGLGSNSHIIVDIHYFFLKFSSTTWQLAGKLNA